MKSQCLPFVEVGMETSLVFVWWCYCQC